MSLAKLLATSIARLYAYAMAPDDHTEQERRDIIDQADTAIDAANTVAWFEEKGSECCFVARGLSYGVWVCETDCAESGSPEGMIEAMKIAKDDADSQSEVDDRNDERKNQGGGNTP
jgi:hypothetical protein